MRHLLLLLLGVLVLMSSCNSSSDVAHDGLLQKRKYRKGIHSNFLTKRKSGETVLMNRDSVSVFDNAGAEMEPLSNEDKDSFVSKDTLSIHQHEPVSRKTRSKPRRTFSDVQAGVYRIQQNARIKWESRNQVDNEGDPDDAQGLGIGSIVVAGLTILIFAQIPIINIVMSVVAIILGNRARDGGAEKLGQVGYVLGLCALGLSILFTLFYAAIIYLVIIGFI